MSYTFILVVKYGTTDIVPPKRHCHRPGKGRVGQVLLGFGLLAAAEEARLIHAALAGAILGTADRSGSVR